MIIPSVAKQIIYILVISALLITGLSFLIKTDQSPETETGQVDEVDISSTWPVSGNGNRPG